MLRSGRYALALRAEKVKLLDKKRPRAFDEKGLASDVEAPRPRRRELLLVHDLAVLFDHDFSRRQCSGELHAPPCDRPTQRHQFPRLDISASMIPPGEGAAQAKTFVFSRPEEARARLRRSYRGAVEGRGGMTYPSRRARKASTSSAERIPTTVPVLLTTGTC